MQVVCCLVSINSIVLNVANNKIKMYIIFEYWSRYMLNFYFFKKGPAIVSPPHFPYDFSRKIFLKLYSINWPNLKIANINILVRFNKAWEIFPSVTRVLSIPLTIAATSAIVERVNSKEPAPKVPCSIPTEVSSL